MLSRPMAFVPSTRCARHARLSRRSARTSGCASSASALTTSSAEAELVAGVAAAKDIKFVNAILEFLWIEVKGPVPLLIDSKAMWFHTRNEGTSHLTRHWEQWLLFVRECYQRSLLSVHKIDTHDEVADLLTKALPIGDGRLIAFREWLLNLQ